MRISVTLPDIAYARLQAKADAAGLHPATMATALLTLAIGHDLALVAPRAIPASKPKRARPAEGEESGDAATCRWGPASGAPCGAKHAHEPNAGPEPTE